MAILVAVTPAGRDTVHAGCAKCQRHKVNTRPTKALLTLIFPEPKANPFEVIALDFITKLPKSQKYDSILTITDHDCSKASLFIPCAEEITAESKGCSDIMGSPGKSLVTGTLDSHQSSLGSCAAS